MKVFLCSGCYNVIMVGHEHDVVDEKAIFFMGFLQCLEENADDLSLVESEGPVVGSTDQVVWVNILNDPQWTSHSMSAARMLPTFIKQSQKCSDTGSY